VARRAGVRAVEDCRASSRARFLDKLGMTGEGLGMTVRRVRSISFDMNKKTPKDHAI
jgi:hypothetical protein